MKDRYPYKKLIFDTYEREVERYGGKHCISLAEKFFYSDSLFISRLCTHDVKELCDVLGFWFVYETCQVALDNNVNIYEMLDRIVSNKAHKKDYRKFKQTYKGHIPSPIGLVEDRELFRLFSARTQMLKNYFITISEFLGVTLIGMLQELATSTRTLMTLLA